MTKSELFDILYKLGNTQIGLDNPCGWKDGQCNRDRVENTKGRCCEKCKYIGPDGCTTKSLGCKLHLCLSANRSYPQLSRYLSALEDVAVCAGIPVRIRVSKEEVL